MAVITGGTAPAESAYERMAADEVLEGRTCYYCREAMTFPCVYWNHYPNSIFLHPDCAVQWMIRLMRDVHAIQRLPKRKP